MVDQNGRLLIQLLVDAYFRHVWDITLVAICKQILRDLGLKHGCMQDATRRLSSFGYRVTAAYGRNSVNTVPLRPGV